MGASPWRSPSRVPPVVPPVAPWPGPVESPLLVAAPLPYPPYGETQILVDLLVPLTAPAPVPEVSRAKPVVTSWQVQVAGQSAFCSQETLFGWQEPG